VFALVLVEPLEACEVHQLYFALLRLRLRLRLRLGAFVFALLLLLLLLVDYFELHDASGSAAASRILGCTDCLPVFACFDQNFLHLLTRFDHHFFEVSLDDSACLLVVETRAILAFIQQICSFAQRLQLRNEYLLGWFFSSENLIAHKVGNAVDGVSLPSARLPLGYKRDGVIRVDCLVDCPLDHSLVYEIVVMVGSEYEVSGIGFSTDVASTHLYGAEVGSVRQRYAIEILMFRVVQFMGEQWTHSRHYISVVFREVDFLFFFFF